MFDNVFTDSLNIDIGGTKHHSEAFVTVEQSRDLNSEIGNIENNYIFIIPLEFEIPISAKIEYQNRIFEIGNITIAKSLDGKKKYYKIKSF